MMSDVTTSTTTDHLRLRHALRTWSFFIYRCPITVSKRVRIRKIKAQFTKIRMNGKHFTGHAKLHLNIVDNFPCYKETALHLYRHREPLVERLRSRKPV